MGKGIRFAILAALAVVGEAPALAKSGPMEFAPTSDWSLDSADGFCALRRDFAAGKHEIALELSSFAYGNTFQAKLASSLGLGTRTNKPRTRFEPDEGLYLQRDGYRTLLPGGRRGVVFKANVFEAALQPAGNGEPDSRFEARLLDNAARDTREAAITGLYIAGSYERDVRLATGELHAPLEQLRGCLAELARREGLDPGKLAGLTALPRPSNMGEWSQHLVKAFPFDRTRTTIDVAMIVDESGAPLTCRVRDNGQSDAFDRSFCSASLAYARFTPALDADGRPVKAYYETTVRYRAD